ncbi:undecaprenyl/decaprenyl-phosphate alpha-N-acetylglucosaminyl 1-phosphate transferase [Dietzia sp. SLG510A3-3B2-2]|nr:undecaprenyl/decaprenyl-phosphate alpha-N-acetylglucosaminyl 1-phosphate transferase [Dietzia sp. SLG510A3-40A3]MBB1010199.1 undecaprenyl/decaprenyl-phosphate alpha-N-acetylglucosaminyl 1-phosphate transferase [Dietzia sp. SLG510A3-3B2-2]
MGAGVPFRELLLIAVTAGLVTFVVTGLVRGVAPAIGGLAYPRERDVHQVPTPRLGGVGIFTGMLIAVYLAAQLPALNRAFPPFAPDVEATIVAGGVIVLVGIVDDILGLGAVTKLAGQAAAAGVLVAMGVSWTLLYIPFGDGNILVLDQLQAGLLTVVFTLTIVNAMNFVDGLDGLAAGLGAIAATAICVFSVGIMLDQGGTVGAYPPALVTAVLAGALIGFLPHNFQPARIFMGDSGSMLIGLVLAAASTSASGKISQSLYGPQDMIVLLSPVIVVAAAMFVPMLDLVMAVVRRVGAGRSPFAPDKMHLHHRLLALGHSHRRVALVIYAWVSLIAFGAVGATMLPTEVIVPAIAAGLISVLAATLVPRLRSARTDDRVGDDNPPR